MATPSAVFAIKGLIYQYVTKKGKSRDFPFFFLRNPALNINN